MPQLAPDLMQRPQSTARYLPELECLRGIAIALVFVYHAAGFIDGSHGQRLGVWVGPWRAFVQAGHTGVSLFFILSAFLLSLPFLEEAAGGKPVDRKRYYERRALRILPLYWLVVVATTVLMAHGVHDLLKCIPYLIFLSSFPRFNALLAPLNGVWWSLATEVQFYLLLPLLPYLLQRRRIGVTAVLLFGGAYVWIAAGVALPISMGAELALRQSVLGRAPMFAAGIVCAWLYLRYAQRFQCWAASSVLRSGGGDACSFAVVLLFGWLLRYVAFAGLWEMELTAHAWHVAEAAFWAATVWMVLLAPLRLRWLIVNPVVAAVGRWSYSIYLLHLPFLYLAFGLLPPRDQRTFAGWEAQDFAILAALALGTTAIAALSYHFVEKPFLVRKARLGR
ncbi:MAG: acyltransferase [Deltaproteobacteria bacterium]|nr:acyltransferase [Deltaproteobacteria bacterium]